MNTSTASPMPDRLRVLLLEDRASDADLITRALRQTGYAPDCHRVETEAEFVAALNLAPNLILADYQLPQFDGLQALRLVRARGLDTPFIVVSGMLGDELAAECIKLGATDYVLKDRLARLGLTVRQALEAQRHRAERRRIESERLAERHQADDQVRKLAAFPKLNPNPVLEFAADGSLNYFNPAATAMAKVAGYTDLSDLLPPETEQIIAKCLATGQPLLRHETKPDHRTLSWSFYPITAGRVVHCYVSDITERLQLEEQFRQAQKMEVIGQLSGGVAHDFNNLLTIMQGHLWMIRSAGGVPPHMADSLKEISLAAERAAQITRQLLTFSRKQIMQQRDLDANEVVANMSGMLERILGSEVKLVLRPAAAPLVIHADTGMIEQVLMNLAVNARDAMARGGQFTIAVAERKQGPGNSLVHFAVSDTGHGMSAEIQAKLFEPFFSTKEVGQGTGLGLAAVYGIVQQHDGWIDVESAPGRGTTFNIFLPRRNVALPAPVSEPPAPAAVGGTETILVVEDEASVRSLLTLLLTNHGYRVHSAATGRAALEVWAAHRAEIHLLLTDLVMPGGLGGLALAARLLAEKPELRVIYMSGYSLDTAGKDFPLREGVNFIAKPFRLTQLVTVIRSGLDARRSQQPFAAAALPPAAPEPERSRTGQSAVPMVAGK